MSNSSGITIMVDGQPTDLADATWLEVAPCGCASGCTVAYLPPPYNVVKATAEQAADDYYETAGGRTQSEKRGFTIIAIRRDTLSERMADCPHIPKWGYERPRPEGMGWAVAKWGRAKVMHLVPADAIDPEKGAPSARPLCKGVETYGWSSKFRAGQPDCEKCISAALAQGVLL